MKKIMGIILSIVGIALILNKVIVQVTFNKNLDVAQKSFEEIGREEIENNLKGKPSYNFDDIDNISLSKAYLSLDDKYNKDIVGQVVIPSLDTNVILFNGINREKLWMGVATMKDGQQMGKGNYSVAGHYGLDEQLFYNLKDMDLNKDIRITDKDKIYIYESIDKQIVEPERIDMIDDIRVSDYGGPIISLMSCYYENGENTGKRIFIIGKLKEVIDYDEDEMTKKEESSLVGSLSY